MSACCSGVSAIACVTRALSSSLALLLSTLVTSSRAWVASSFPVIRFWSMVWPPVPSSSTRASSASRFSPRAIRPDARLWRSLSLLMIFCISSGFFPVISGGVTAFVFGSMITGGSAAASARKVLMSSASVCDSPWALLICIARNIASIPTWSKRAAERFIASLAASPASPCHVDISTMACTLSDARWLASPRLATASESA
ncbi:Uncharacterised protein [Mycobacteroides abscessus subsp. abscessus]|nr:Uncharacterised protein [Mycobacteroides abscessus subsp. abscessus]